MRFLKALIVTGVLSALVIFALIWYAGNRQESVPPTPLPTPVTSAPTPEPVTPPAPPAEETKTYTDEKAGFSVTYPVSIMPTADKQDMQLSGYIPVCDPDVAIACFPIGKAPYAGKNFENAAFAVHVQPKLKTDATCSAIKPQSGETADGGATIGGIAFKKFAFGDAAAGHQLSGERYRVFRNGNCYELATSTGTTTFENYPAGTILKFTDQDRADVQRVLDTMLMSFRFLS
jgi:hypothetical protein